MKWEYDKYGNNWWAICPLRPLGAVTPVGSVAMGRVFHDDERDVWTAMVFISEPYEQSDLAMKTALVMRRSADTLDDAHHIAETHMRNMSPGD